MTGYTARTHDITAFQKKLNPYSKPVYLSFPRPPQYRFLNNAQVSKKSARLVAELPVEILGVIFTYCLSRLYQSAQGDFPVPYEAPMLLCRVCSRWRQIALNMPMLWTTLSTMEPPGYKKSRCLSLMKLWLERSQECSLFLRLESSEPDDNGGLLKELLPLFLSEVDRWRRVSIELNTSVCENFLLAAPGAEPRLKKLSLRVANCTDEQASQLPTILNKFSQLQEFHLNGTSPTPLFGLRFTFLTHIQLDTPLPLDQCVSILGECSSAVEFIAPDLHNPTALVPPMNMIRLPTLIKLELCALGWMDTGELLSYITCPALSELCIIHNRDAQYLSDFLARSACELKVLKLIEEHAPEFEILSCFSAPALRSLRSLLLHGLGPRAEIVRALVYTDNDDAITAMPFLPFLEILDLETEQVPDGLVSDMIYSRTRGDTKIRGSLKKVQIQFSHYLETFPLGYRGGDGARKVHQSDARRLGEFRDAGLSVFYRFHDFRERLYV